MKKVASVVLSFLVAGASSASAVTVVDDFSAGIAQWSVSSNQPLYSMDLSGQSVRFSKPVGGSGFQAIELVFCGQLQGDFDVSVAFQNASIQRINGSPANQVQLNVQFGGQYVALVRDDDIVGGNNRHVYRNPPSAWADAAPATHTTGTMRLARVGSTLSAYYNGALFHSANYNSADVTRLWFSLQNNGTSDATAVTFDDASITAGNIVWTCGPTPATRSSWGTVKTIYR